MSGQAVAPSRRGLKKAQAKTKCSWFTPPPETPLYAAVPDVAPDFRSALSTTQWAVYQFLTDRRNGAKEDGNGGWILEAVPSKRRSLAPSYHRIAVALRISRSTVWRTVKQLIAKHCIETRAVYTGRNASEKHLMPGRAETRAFTGLRVPVQRKQGAR